MMQGRLRVLLRHAGPIDPGDTKAECRSAHAVPTIRGHKQDVTRGRAETVRDHTIDLRVRLVDADRVHRQDRTALPAARALYDDNPAFNDSVDETHGMIRIFEVEFRPSEVLFQMELTSPRRVVQLGC